MKKLFYKPTIEFIYGLEDVLTSSPLLSKDPYSDDPFDGGVFGQY